MVKVCAKIGKTFLNSLYPPNKVYYVVLKANYIQVKVIFALYNDYLPYVEDKYTYLLNKL